MPRDWASIGTGDVDVDYGGMSLTDVDVALSENGASIRDVDQASINGRADVDQLVAEKHGGESGWIADPREEQEPWRGRFPLQECEHVNDDGTTCGVPIRGSDRCPDHKRVCWGTNKKGEPCRSPPLKGTDECLSHPRPGRDRDTSMGATNGASLQAGARFGSSEQAAEAGRAGGLARRYPRLTEEVQRQIEERAAKVVGAGIEALDATRPVVVEESGTDENGRRFTRQEVIEYPDHLVRLKAHEALTNRAFGRPHQAMDINQETRQLTLQLDATDPVVREGLHSFLRQRPGVTA